MKTPLLLGILLVCAALVGCGGSKPAPSVAPKAAPKATVAAADVTADAGTAEAAQPYVYTYTPLGKRDPFRSPEVDVKQTMVGSSVCSEPLCQWDLDQLSLVGVVTGDANPIAMVQDPQTRGYIIRRGTRVGKQGGQVTQILRDTVTVTEYFQSPDGKRTPNPVMMHLKPDAQSVPEMDLMNNKPVQ